MDSDLCPLTRANYLDRSLLGLPIKERAAGAISWIDFGQQYGGPSAHHLSVRRRERRRRRGCHGA